MKAVIQRVQKAKLTADGVPFSEIGKGMFILLGVGSDDTEKDVDFLVHKCANLRIFEDENGKMNLSSAQINGEILAVSQFTLLGSCAEGNRPYFGGAARPELAKPLYERFCDEMGKRLPTKTGVFGAHMEIETVCDGPVTILMDTKELMK
ncbi:MAG: D-tyrosyl-tRNA(Tyr) deacylase [Clostridia bacterium]|nr:D-tyrosyl-tRNA(Tyr) deacylase [Clostridia bacterium]